MRASHGYHPAVLKITRLFQPRNPAFWLMLGLNLLSLLLAWVIENRRLNGAGLLVVAVLAIGNAALGLWLAWRLMQPSPDVASRSSAD